MKLARTIMVVAIGVSLSAPSAFAEAPGLDFLTWVYRITHQDPPSTPSHNNGSKGMGNGGCTHGGGQPSAPSTPPSTPKS